MVILDDDVKLTGLSFGNQHISVMIFDSRVICKVSFVYARCQYAQRWRLWNDLENENNLSCLWLIAGDINIISSDSERSGGRPRLMMEIKEFNNWIHACGLLEMSFLEKSLSWCNRQASRSWSWARLDRTLVDQNLLTEFPDSKMRYLPRTSFDYAPMVIPLCKNEEAYGPSPF